MKPVLQERGHHSEQPLHHDEKWAAHTTAGGSPSAGVKTQDTKNKQVSKKKRPTLIQDKLDFKTTCITRDTEEYFIMIKGLFHQEDM